METRERKLERMLRNLFDAHYGVSYHHCGDGDGLSKEDAQEIVEFIKSPDQSAVVHKPSFDTFTDEEIHNEAINRRYEFVKWM